MAGEQWYYVQAGQRLGPVPVETLRSLLSASAISGADLVWSEGMADWVAAASVPGLAPVPRPSAPAYNPPFQDLPNRPPQGLPNRPPQYAAPQPYHRAQDLPNRPPLYAVPQQYPQPQHGTPDQAQAGYGQPVGYYAPQRQAASNYAGFWLRFIALLIDGVILGVVFLIIFAALAAVTGFSLMNSSSVSAEEVGTAVVLWYGASLAIPWLYYALLESSPSQGTPGKRALGLRVTDIGGGRISFGQATGRYFGRILSSFFLVGYLMTAFTERKQSLHDIVAGCVVVQA